METRLAAKRWFARRPVVREGPAAAVSKWLGKPLTPRCAHERRILLAAMLAASSTSEGGSAASAPAVRLHFLLLAPHFRSAELSARPKPMCTRSPFPVHAVYRKVASEEVRAAQACSEVLKIPRDQLRSSLSSLERCGTSCASLC